MHINVLELKQRLENGNCSLQLLDVRQPWEFSICHIDGSQLIPMHEIPSRLEQIDPEQELVVICHTGMRSQQVCLYLRHAGFENVLNLTGGVHAWATQVDPTMATY
jgi:rhodanese-related sulfurtransferase